MRLGGRLNRFFFLFWFSFFSTLIPRPLQRIFTLFIGNFFYLIMSTARRGVKANLRVIGKGKWSNKEIAALARRTFQNYGQYLLDYMVMSGLTAQRKGSMVARELGQSHMVRALKQGNGVICITPHLGNWELGGLLLAFRGADLYVLQRFVSRRVLDPPFFESTGGGVPETTLRQWQQSAAKQVKRCIIR